MLIFRYLATIMHGKTSTIAEESFDIGSANCQHPGN